MKAKHVLWIFAGLVAVVTMAVGVAVLVDRYLNRKECPDGYIECVTEDAEDDTAEA
jgi:NADH:ubiquinone oxidoreductase subunit K